jgi:hypothetical protein
MTQVTVIKTLAKWSINDYHRMIETGILHDRQVELLGGKLSKGVQKHPCIIRQPSEVRNI